MDTKSLCILPSKPEYMMCLLKCLNDFLLPEVLNMPYLSFLRSGSYPPTFIHYETAKLFLILENMFLTFNITHAMQSPILSQ